MKGRERKDFDKKLRKEMPRVEKQEKKEKGKERKGRRRRRNRRDQVKSQDGSKQIRQEIVLRVLFELGWPLREREQGPAWSRGWGSFGSDEGTLPYLVLGGDTEGKVPR